MAHPKKSATYNKRGGKLRPKATVSRRKTAPDNWAEAVKQFTAHLNGPAEASRLTIDHYGRDLEKFAEWWDANRKDQLLSPGAILGSDIREWRDWLRTELIEPGTPRERIRKASSVNTLMAPLKSLLLWAADTGLISEPPVMPKRVKAVKPVYKAVPRPEQKRLLRAIEGKRVKRDLALTLVLLDGGLRIAELCALLWRDVALSARQAGLYVWHGKGDKQREVPLSNRARKALLEHRGSQRPPDEPVFTSRKGGGAMTPRAVQFMLRRYAKPLGIRVSPHMLRHSYATDALDRGNQVPAVQAILGHRSPMTTLGYCTASPENLRRAVERDDD